MNVEHPRPQLVRERFKVLDGAWGFAVDEHLVGLPERWYATQSPFTRTIEVPFPPESVASGIGEDVTAPVWYRREVELKAVTGRLFLHFEAVDYRTTVWVNGERAGEHEGGMSRFSLDVTDVVREGSNVLVVRAEDDVDDLEQPRGKQDWAESPHVIWYGRTTGIWRSVWLEEVSTVHLTELTLVARDDLASFELEARIAGPVGPDVVLELELSLQGRLLAEVAVGGRATARRATVVLDHESLDTEPEELWWSPERPTLLDVRARLRRDGVVLDEVTSYAGLRTVGTEDDRILLNGRPYFLRFVLEQGYWPDSHLAAPSAEALRREAELIKELGFNGLRMHQTSADPRFLAWCDRLGLLVWADAAAAYTFSARALRRTLTELAELVARDRGHPCVMAWVPFNESWGVPRLRTSRAERDAVVAGWAMVRALDPSRIVLGNDGWQHVVGDVVGIHDYGQDPAHLKERYGSASALRDHLENGYTGGRRLVLRDDARGGQCLPVVLSEFGGISVHEDTEAWAAYGEVLDPDRLPRALGALVDVVGETSGLAGFCYTQLTDTLQEKNGLLTQDRKPKQDPEAIRRAVSARA